MEALLFQCYMVGFKLFYGDFGWWSKGENSIGWVL